MKELGGYLELEHFRGKDYYPNDEKLNLGRTACAHFLASVGCQTVYLPAFLCASVSAYLEKAGFEIRKYHLDEKLQPLIPDDLAGRPLPEGVWLFLNNAYGQLSDETIRALHQTHHHLLVDHTHAFFRKPLPEVASVCSVRKFFGVSDGAYLHTPTPLPAIENKDRSAARFAHLLGRFEESASAHYQEMLQTAATYHDAPLARMSALTENLLCGIDYAFVIEARTRNYAILADAFAEKNPLAVCFHTPADAPFVYPLLVTNGPHVRKALAEKGIYIPTYWRELFDDPDCSELEQNYARNILALPVDQRYGEADMHLLARAVNDVLAEETAG